MVCLSFASPAQAWELKTDGGTTIDHHGMNYIIDGDGYLRIIVYRGDGDYSASFEGTGEDPEKLVVPDVMGGVSVTEVQIQGIENNTVITSVEFPSSMKTLQMGWDCLPSVESISFRDRDELALEELTAGIGVNPWQSLKQFNAGTANDGNQGVEYDIVIPDSVTSLSGLGFKGSDATSLYIGTGVKNFDGSDGFFGEMTELERVYNASSLLYSFTDSSKLTEMVNAGEIDSVPANAFQGNTSLTTIELPATVTSIGDYAFAGCTGLTSLDIPESVTSIGANAFDGCASLESIELPEGLVSLGNNALRGCSGLEEITIPASVESLPMALFANCTSLKKVVVEGVVTNIPSQFFKDCESLESFEYDGKNLISIDSRAFEGVGLKTFEIPEGVQDIAPSAFGGSSIEAVKFPSTLWAQKQFSMSEGSSQDFIVAPEVSSQGSASSAALFPLSVLALVNDEGIPVNATDGVRILTDKSFWNTSLRAVDLTDWARNYIPHYMFSGAAALEYIEIPRSVSQIGYGAFTDCVSLKDVYVYNLNGVELAETFTGGGSTTGGQTGWTSVYPGTFSKHAFNVAQADATSQDFDTYTDLDSLTIYGAASATNLAEYAAAHENYTYVPFAFIGDGGSSDDVQAKFGATMPENPVSIASFVAGGTPVIQVSYPYDEGVSRTLVPGEDCTVIYTDAAGNEVTSFDKAGAYTATITGDNKSVWGTTQVSFSVAAAGTVTIPVADGQNTGITAEGALVAEDGADVVLNVEPVTSGEAYDALVAAMGDGTLAGAYEATLLVNGQPVHDGFGTITLTFPVDPKWNGYNVTVWHRHGDGSITSETVVAADGKVSVTVTDLSTFALEVGQKAQQDVVPPQNQDQNQNQGSSQNQGLQQVGASGSGQTLTALASTGDELPVVPAVALAGAAACALGAAALASRRGRKQR